MKLAIIGGGFSGISLSAHLMLNKSLDSIYLIDKGTLLGKGVAYSTPYSWHLLNVRVGQMGALANDPEGFLNWLQENPNYWKKLDPSFSSLSINSEDFVPRMIYGAYLNHLLEKIKKQSNFQVMSKEAINLFKLPSGELQVKFKDGESLNCDKVVLATGVQVTKQLSFGIKHSRYIPNIWEGDPATLRQQLSNTNKNSTLFIVGAGLTMIDMITTLVKSNYEGRIVSLSHHGHLPSPQFATHLPFLEAPEILLNNQRLLEKFVLFRELLNTFEKKSGNWRQFFDALRPHATNLWQHLSLSDKKRFLRHLISPWNKHRHRMPQESADIIDLLISNRRLEILAGEIIKLDPNHDHIKVNFHLKGKDAVHTLNADYVYNCTGPEYHPKKQSQQLYTNLLQQKMIQPDDLELGIKSNSHFQAVGPVSDQLYVMGSLLFGERFESTAVPELRQQAAAIASLCIRNTDEHR